MANNGCTIRATTSTERNLYSIFFTETTVLSRRSQSPFNHQLDKVASHLDVTGKIDYNCNAVRKHAEWQT
jgi:hypothetical protein